MSNQRAGKWKPASISDQISGARAFAQVDFFKECAKLLEAKGEADAAFYFEQCESWIRDGKELSAPQAARILGL